MSSSGLAFEAFAGEVGAGGKDVSGVLVAADSRSSNGGQASKQASPGGQICTEGAPRQSDKRRNPLRPYRRVVVLKRFERGLESLVEGTFARVFRNGLTPIEIGQRVAREIDANQTAAADGSLIVPNHYWVYVSTPDHSRFSETESQLTNELIESARAHIKEEQLRVLGPVSITLVEAPDYPQGTLQVRAQWRERVATPAPGPTSPAPPERTASLRLLSGERLELRSPFTVGRMPGGGLVIADDGVSRNHAVIELGPNGWSVRDLDSTNGTTVNGTPVGSAMLRHGDSICFAATPTTFEAY